MTLKQLRKEINKYCKEHPEDLDKQVIKRNGAEMRTNICKPYGESNQWMVYID